MPIHTTSFYARAADALRRYYYGTLRRQRHVSYAFFAAVDAAADALMPPSLPDAAALCYSAAMALLR